MDLAFVVWDGAYFVSRALPFPFEHGLDVEREEKKVFDERFADCNSCPDEAKCLCDVYGVGDCS